MSKISKNITYKEATDSYTAKRNHIDNSPNIEQLLCMKQLADNVFEKVREHFHAPIKVNSFFRSEELNKFIGGAKSSQHCLGKAMDIDDTYGGYSNADMFNYIKDNLEFDQLIWEYGNEDNPDWVHVSYNQGKNRKEILRSIKRKGYTHYEKYV